MDAPAAVELDKARHPGLTVRESSFKIALAKTQGWALGPIVRASCNFRASLAGQGLSLVTREFARAPRY